MHASILSALTTMAIAPLNVAMGDGSITGKEVHPYEYSWRQCSLVDGQWTNGSDLTERVTLIGDHVMRVEHSTSPQPGIISDASYFLDRSSLSPIRSEIRIVGSDGKALAEHSWAFGKAGYKAVMKRGDKVTRKTGGLNNSMYHAILLGIPLSAIDDWSRPIRMIGMMTQFDASYTLTATRSGTEAISAGGKDSTVSLIDVHWVHNEIGDVYPAGPNASGGRYWITVEAQSKLPRVIRYKTDTYVVEYVPRFCPSDSSDLSGNSSENGQDEGV